MQLMTLDTQPMCVYLFWLICSFM